MMDLDCYDHGLSTCIAVSKICQCISELIH